jgi:3-hydroxyisobutyrate dehydrogenase
MPVSGSRIPAEHGKLVGMLAGERAVAERVRDVLEPITSAAVYCGPIGSGLKTKYAVNLYLITMTAGLAESMALAQAQRLDLEAFGKVLNAGPMASAYSKLKISKMLNHDWTAQAAIKDCYNSTQLIQSAGKDANTKTPLVEVCGSLYKQANEVGLGEEDMIAITKLFSK